MGDLVRRYRLPALSWALVGAVLVVVQRVTVARRNQVADLWSWPGGQAFFGGWTQFDGWEYLHIAEDGYWYRPAARAPVVFFPLYPLVVRAAHAVTGQWVLAGVVVAAVAGLAATLLFWRWCGTHGLAPAAQQTALFVALLYPFGWYLYGVVYADALFVALVIAAFSLVDARRYVLGGLVGALATATRPTGLALVPGLLVLALETGGVLAVPAAASGLVDRWRLPVAVHRSRLRAVLLAPLLSLAGTAAYATYLGIRFNRPLVFVTDQTQYQGSGIKTLLKAGLVADLVRWDDPAYTLSAAIQAVLVVAVIWSVPRIGRRFGWGYGSFVLSLAAILVLESRDFLGAGRYLLAAFPVAALVGEALAARPRARIAWLVGAACLLVLGTVGFAQSRMLT